MVLMSIVSTFVYNSIAQQSKTAEWVEHTHEAISSSREILTLLIDMETGERGFLITGKEEFLEPYYRAQKKWNASLESLNNTLKTTPTKLSV